MEINEKKLESIIKEQRIEYERYLGILYEKLESKVELLGENIIGVREDMSSMKEEWLTLKKMSVVLSWIS